jgi:threonine/homoserine/homoserine lactone efflux protein
VNDLLSLFVKGIALGLSAGIAPGPLTFLVISQTIRYGFLAGIKSGLAPLLTDIPIILVCVSLSKNFEHLPLLLPLVSLLGSLFLFKMAFDNWYAPPVSTLPSGEGRAPLIQGVVTNLLNPHPYVFWLTIGSPLILQSDSSPLAAGATFTAGMFIFLIGTKVCIAWVTCKIRNILSGPGYRWALRGSAVFLFFFAFSFLGECLRHLGVVL